MFLGIPIEIWYLTGKIISGIVIAVGALVWYIKWRIKKYGNVKPYFKYQIQRSMGWVVSAQTSFKYAVCDNTIIIDRFEIVNSDNLQFNTGVITDRVLKNGDTIIYSFKEISGLPITQEEKIKQISGKYLGTDTQITIYYHTTDNLYFKQLLEWRDNRDCFHSPMLKILFLYKNL